MFEKDHVYFNKNKDRYDGKGGRGRDKEMTSKGRRKYHVNHGSSYKEPLSMQELKELIDSLRAAPEGTTLITFRRRKSGSTRKHSVKVFPIRDKFN